MGLAGTAAEQPDLLGIEHLDDAIDDAGRDGCSSHAEIVVVEAAGVEGEVCRTLPQRAREISETCTVGNASSCHGVADPCNGPLHEVALLDPVVDALDQVRAAWIADRNARRLRRDLLRLLAELED